MSLFLFIGIGASLGLVLRLVMPRLSSQGFAFTLTTGAAGATLAGVVASSFSRDGSLFQVHPVAVAFAVVGAVMSLLWLTVLTPIART